MPDFKYTARSKEGETEVSVISAVNEKAVVDFVREKGLVPTSVAEVKKSYDLSAVFTALQSVKLIDKITLIKNLGVMIKSGLPVSKSLKILTAQTSNPKLANIVGSVSRAVESGTALSEALSKYPDVFSGIFVSMVRVGEVSGNLEQNLGYLAEQMQRDYNLISKAKGAMTYPAVVLVALVLVGFSMFTFVLPKLTATFKEFDVELPLMTKVVIATVDFFASYGLFLMPLFVLMIFFLLYWRKTDSGKSVIHNVVLYMPVFGKIVKKINMARFLGVFSSLLKSGMPIVDSLSVSADVVGNVYYKSVIVDAAKKVRTGTSLTASFKKHPHLFDPLVVQMMEVGEESGTTDTVLVEVANFYESEVDQTMKNLSSILEPVLMLIIGIVVGVLAVALISPIYSITQNV
jgi:type IV pilus assembly protein PilC